MSWLAAAAFNRFSYKDRTNANDRFWPEANAGTRKLHVGEEDQTQDRELRANFAGKAKLLCVQFPPCTSPIADGRWLVSQRLEHVPGIVLNRTQKRFRRTCRLSATLFPISQRRHLQVDKARQFRLRQARGCSNLLNAQSGDNELARRLALTTDLVHFHDALDFARVEDVAEAQRVPR